MYFDELIENLKSVNKEQKRQCLQQLLSAPPLVIDPVLQMLGNATNEELVWALEGVSYVEEDPYLSPLDFSLLENTIGYYRWYVLACAKILIAQGLIVSTKLRSLMPTSRPAVKAMIVFLLGEIGDRRAIPVLIDCLKSDLLLEQIAAIRALGKLKATSALEHLHSLLENEETTFDTAIALARIGDKRSLDALIKQFRQNRAFPHITAAVLIKLGDIAVEPLIDVISNPENQPVHEHAVEALVLLEAERAVPTLIKLLETSPNHKVQYQCIVALGKLKATAAFELLTKFMQYPMEPLNQRTAATKALAILDPERAFEFFTQLLKDQALEFDLTHHALMGYNLLENLPDPQPLINLISHPDSRIRPSVVWLLFKFMGETARPFLEACLNDPDWRTRTWAAEYVRRLDNQATE